MESTRLIDRNDVILAAQALHACNVQFSRAEDGRCNEIDQNMNSCVYKPRISYNLVSSQHQMVELLPLDSFNFNKTKFIVQVIPKTGSFQFHVQL